MKRFTQWLIPLIAFFALSATASMQTNQKGFEQYGKLIFEVSKKTNIPVMDLVATVSMESTFKSKSVNREGSRAAGLNGMIPRTWNALIKKHGKKHGIKPGTSRFNARANLLLTAEYMKDNRAFLEKKLHRKIDSSEVILANLLGPGGALKMLKADNNKIAYRAVNQNPNQNKRYFIKANGKARTVGEFKTFSKQLINKHKEAYHPHVTTLAFDNQLHFVDKRV